MEKSLIAELPLEEFFEVFRQHGNIEVPLIPSVVGSFECGIVRIAVFAYPFGHDLPTVKQLAMFQANKIIASRPGRSSIALNEWMNPIQPPQCKRC